MKEEPIKSPIQAEDIAQEKLEGSMESVMEKSGEKDTEVFVSAFLKAMRGPKGDQGDKGDAGKDYKLTELDKKAIANMVYQLAQDRMDGDIENVVSDVVAIMESKVPEAVKGEFEKNRGSIEEQVTSHFNKIVGEVRDENSQLMNQVMKVVADTKKSLQQDSKTIKQQLDSFWSTKQKEIQAKYNDQPVDRIIGKIRGEIAWSDIKDRPNVISGLAHLVDVDTSGLTQDAQGRFLLGSGGSSVETPVGAVDGSNASFTVANEPLWVIGDGITYFDGAGYSYSAGTITMETKLVSFIRSIY